MPTRWLRIVLIVFGLSIDSSAFAVSAMQYLNHPLPNSLRIKVEKMLVTLRPNDIAEASANIFVTEGIEENIGILILRIKTDCQDNICMTIIVNNDEKEMIPELIINAGEAFVVSDAAYSLWGLNAWRIAFQGEGGSTLLATQRGEQWVMRSCAECMEWPTSTVQPPPAHALPKLAPPPPPEPMNFEEFRRQLDR